MITGQARQVSEANLTRHWSNSLHSYLTDHPEALENITSLASSSVTTSKSVINGSQNFFGPGSFGGDNNGTVNVNA
jgi:hypothetical protein